MKQKVKLFIEVNAVIHNFEHHEQLESLDVHVVPNKNNQLTVIGWASLMGNKIVLTNPQLIKCQLPRKTLVCNGKDGRVHWSHH